MHNDGRNVTKARALVDGLVHNQHMRTRTVLANLFLLGAWVSVGTGCSTFQMNPTGDSANGAGGTTRTTSSSSSTDWDDGSKTAGSTTSGTAGQRAAGEAGGDEKGGARATGRGGAAANGGRLGAGGAASGRGGGEQDHSGGDATGEGGTAETSTSPARHQAAYPAIDSAKAACGSWALVDNVCCAQYCSNDMQSESCDKCGGASSAECTQVSSKACVSGEWPEVRSVSQDEPWHHSRSTHFGLTNGGACAFGYYGLCNTEFAFTDPKLAANCDAFCKAYPDLCKDPEGTTLRGNFAAPQGNYYTQFWPSLPGDRDNYLSCGECFEVVRTKADGTEYQSGEAGYQPSVVLQIVDSCPCSANSKWCCGSGRDHCGEVSESNPNSSLHFKYGCPLPPGPPDPPADRDPLPNESIHLDLSDIAMARLQSGDPNRGMVDGVIATKYRRVPCPVVGNVYIWLRSGASEYYFALSVVNVANLGAVTGVEAKLASGDWAPMHRDANYTSARPQERYGTWVVKDQTGPYSLPLSLRITDGLGQALELTDAIKAWAPADASRAEIYYIDTGMQF